LNILSDRFTVTAECSTLIERPDITQAYLQSNEYSDEKIPWFREKEPNCAS